MRMPTLNEIESFIETSGDLAEICDRKLWRGKYASFSDYCEKRWGLDPVRIFELIALAEEIQTEGTDMNNLVAEWRRERKRG